MSGDYWDGMNITLPMDKSTLGVVRLEMRRQASSTDEPRQSWSSSEGSIVLTEGATSGTTVANVIGRVLSNPGVMLWRVVIDADAKPQTVVMGTLKVDNQ